jgi:dolichol-phosphate mannosyltransferase
MGTTSTIIVVPTYNERDMLPRFVERLAPLGVDCLVVDDSSPDGTGELAEELAATRPWLHVLHRTEKDGLGAAYRAGFAWALARGYGRVAQMDSDLSHPPEALESLIAALDAGADVAIGSRFVRGGGTEGWPRWRKAQSHAACIPARLLLRVPVRDLTGGFKLWRADALERIDVASTRSQGYVFQVETTQRAERAGLRIVEVPFTFSERTAGQSKMRASIALEGVRMVARLRRDGWQPQPIASAARTGA